MPTRLSACAIIFTTLRALAIFGSVFCGWRATRQAKRRNFPVYRCYLIFAELVASLASDRYVLTSNV
jgi:hypothetical protein